MDDELTIGDAHGKALRLSPDTSARQRGHSRRRTAAKSRAACCTFRKMGRKGKPADGGDNTGIVFDL